MGFKCKTYYIVHDILFTVESILNIAVHGRVYTVRMSKAMAVQISSFGLVCIYGIMS